MTAPRWYDLDPVVPRDSQSLSYSPVLRVDPERVEGLAGRLEGAIRTIAYAERELEAIMTVSPPGSDPVSSNAAAQAGLMVEESMRYLSSWRMNLEVAHEALERQMSDYKSAEKAISARA